MGKDHQARIIKLEQESRQRRVEQRKLEGKVESLIVIIERYDERVGQNQAASLGKAPTRQQGHFADAGVTEDHKTRSDAPRRAVPAMPGFLNRDAGVTPTQYDAKDPIASLQSQARNPSTEAYCMLMYVL